MSLELTHDHLPSAREPQARSMRVFVLSAMAGLALLVSACSGSSAGEDTVNAPDPEAAAEAEAVSELAATFLAALSAADTAELSRSLAPGAMVLSVREGESGPILRAVTREDFLTSLGGEDQELLERMWDPEVKVDGDVAMVWTPYDFFLNGEFSHCGTDAFTFLKGPEGWQVAAITYNVVREGCTPSPLGPPERSRQ